MMFKRVAVFLAVVLGLLSIFFMMATMTLLLAHGIGHTTVDAPKVWEGYQRAMINGLMAAAFAAAAR